MKEILLIALFALNLSFANAQKEVYLDSNQNEVSVKQFNDHLIEAKKGWGFVIKDSTYFYSPSKGYKLGKLDEKSLQSFLDDLKINHQIQTATNQVLCIGYFGVPHYKFNHFKEFKVTKRGHFSDYETSNQYKFINVPKAKIVSFNIHDQELLRTEEYKKLKLTKIDSLGIMRKIFQLSYPYASYFYLKQNGDYLIIYGISVNRPDFNKQVKYFLEN